MSEPAEHPVERFRRQLEGLAFFSAAAGLLVTDSAGPLPPFAFGGVMFVGHNLDSEIAFRRRLMSGRAHGGPDRPMLTWRNLYRLLDGAGLAAGDCFFTNAYVGLKAGDDPTGRFPGADDHGFRLWCRGFLEEQVAVMKPRALATLGTGSRRFLSTMAPELAAWASPRNPAPGVVRAHLGDHDFAAVAILHPSGYHGSFGRRRYRDCTGLEAEAALLRDAVA